jgi:arabinose-5-phosphate isomerase
MVSASQAADTTWEDHLAYARQVLENEAAALALVRDRLNESFCRAAVLMFDCSGCVIVTGMGKAGLVGQKIAATLASTGTRAHSLNPAEAMHGDLGRIGPNDVVLALSYSGETEEVVRLLAPIRRIGARIVALTSREQSRLARQADVVVAFGPLEEACPMGLAPSATTTAMMALGDALAFVISKMRNFQADEFARNHPGGALGRLSTTVDELMRTGDQLRLAHLGRTVRQAIIDAHRQGRRTGAILLVDDAGRMQGIFTDSDLVRLLECDRESALDRPVAAVMTARPTVIRSGTRVRDAIRLLSIRKFSQLPVLDEHDRPLGILDITDLIGLVPDAESAAGAASRVDAGHPPEPAGPHRSELEPATAFDTAPPIPGKEAA